MYVTCASSISNPNLSSTYCCLEKEIEDKFLVCGILAHVAGVGRDAAGLLQGADAAMLCML